MQVVADAREVAQADAIMFAVKMRDTESAAQSLVPLVAEGAAVFTFQNGVESAERVGAIVGAGNVVPGVARIGSHISEPGVVKQIGTFCRLEFAERDGKPSAAHRGAARGVQACGLRGRRCRPTSSREIWMKFAMLAPLAGMTALTRAPIGPDPRQSAIARAAARPRSEETVAVGVALKTGLEASRRRHGHEADRQHSPRA